MRRRTVGLALLLATAAIVGCSSVEEIPLELQGMAADEVGCRILYGSDSSIVGPLGVGDVAVVKPNDWTSFRIWRTALDLGLSIRTQWGGSDFSIPSDELPDDHVVAQHEMRDAGNPGYRIMCWQGGN
jgi:hypothetical protein